MGVLEVGDGGFEVMREGSEVGVTEHLGDGHGMGSTTQHVGGAGAAECVRVGDVGQFGQASILLDLDADGLLLDGATTTESEPEGISRVTVTGEDGTGLF